MTTSNEPNKPATTGGILPGMAAIAMFLLVVAMLEGFRELHEKSAGHYSILAICTMVVVGVFGLLRLKRWGWSLVCAGCLIGSLGCMIASRASHDMRWLVEGGFLLVFFLYMVRPEVRERVR